MFKITEFKRRLDEAREFLEEKLIQYNGGKKYGQIVFLAGGAGSGKGFASSQFMESEKFKIRDVDEMKKAMIRLSQLGKTDPSLADLDLRNPKHVSHLHGVVEKKGLKDKTLTLLLRDLKAGNGQLPNILFDITAKSLSGITKVIPLLVKAGYEARDIHITWVLTDYLVAIDNNAGRDRVVPADILMGTHVGASQTMQDVIFKEALPRSMIDGGIYVVLNNKDHTVVYTGQNKDIRKKDERMIRRKLARQGKTEAEITAIIKAQTTDTNASDKVLKMPDQKSTGGMRDKDSFKLHVKSFSYVTMKKPGKPMNNSAEVKMQVSDWIKANAPKESWIDTIAA